MTQLESTGMTPQQMSVKEWEQADRVLTCTFEYRTVLLSFVSYESHGKAASDGGE